MLTLTEIAEYVNSKKKKYGKSLIYHMKSYYDDGHTNDYILKKLNEQYNIKITLGNLKELKRQYYIKLEIDKPLKLHSQIEQKQENKTTPLQEINKIDSRTDYQKLRDSLDLPDLNSAEEIIRRENEKNEKLKNLLKRKKD